MEASGAGDVSDELRSNFLRAATGLSELPLFLRAQLSSLAKPGRLKEDRCQVCGLRLDELDVKLRTAPGKQRKAKLVVTCSGCKSESFLSLPRRKQEKKQVPDSKTRKREKKKLKPVQLPVLTKAEKRSSKANRLAKLVASMTREEEKEAKDGSSLASFLRSLGN